MTHSSTNEITVKQCRACNEIKPVSEFHKSGTSKDGYRTKCRICSNKVRRERLRKNKEGDFAQYDRLEIDLPDELIGDERAKAYHKEYRKLKRKEIGRKKQEEANQAKIEGIAYYGGKCACCSEDTFEFLTLEHKNGREPGKRRRTGKWAWLEVKRAGFPDTITVLCFNCNCAKGAYGSCPHTWENKRK